MAKKQKAAKATRKAAKAKSTKPKVARKKAVSVKNLAAPDAGKTKRATALGIRRLV